MTHSNKNPTAAKLMALLCVLLFCGYGYFYLMATTTSGDDVLECQAIARFAESSHQFPPSLSAPGLPAFFCDAEARGILLRRIDHIRIYGVVDRREQDSVMETLGRTHEHLRTRRPMVVDFYEKENWKTWNSPSGNRGGERGPETSLRTNTIK